LGLEGFKFDYGADEGPFVAEPNSNGWWQRKQASTCLGLGIAVWPLCAATIAGHTLVMEALQTAQRDALVWGKRTFTTGCLRSRITNTRIIECPRYASTLYTACGTEDS
jgi:hypothetical protein